MTPVEVDSDLNRATNVSYAKTMSSVNSAASSVNAAAASRDSFDTDTVTDERINHRTASGSALAPHDLPPPPAVLIQPSQHLVYQIDQLSSKSRSTLTSQPSNVADKYDDLYLLHCCYSLDTRVYCFHVFLHIFCCFSVCSVTVLLNQGVIYAVF